MLCEHGSALWGKARVDALLPVHRLKDSEATVATDVCNELEEMEGAE